MDALKAHLSGVLAAARVPLLTLAGAGTGGTGWEGGSGETTGGTGGAGAGERAVAGVAGNFGADRLVGLLQVGCMD